MKSPMLTRSAPCAVVVACIMVLTAAWFGLKNAQAQGAGAHDGLIQVRSAYPIDETIERIKKDIADKGILFFQAVDQAKLAANAGIKLPPSILLTFGNPPLGAQFLTSNPNSGLDWPVRLLVRQDPAGVVWAVYTDFEWIAQRHRITDRKEQFAKASSVVESITASIRAH
jgi:uncharacterized protein (DUF302 family)